MISNSDKTKILELAKKYKVNRVLLFGSSIDSMKPSNDIDLAVEGIQDSLFFKFYGELILHLSKPVDLIDLRKKSYLSEIVKSEGILIYG